MSDMVEKWGQAVAERGFAQIPNYLLLLNNFIDEDRRLTPVEMLVLLQLVGAWWQKDNMPFPSMGTLAKRAGVSERQVQRAVTRLVKDNIIAKKKRRTQGIIASNAYDLAPLVELLEGVAKAYPNEFPRVIKRRQIAPKNLAELAATDTTDIEPKTKVTPKGKIVLKKKIMKNSRNPG
ncbi:helix-turn-helix domain-containing protein [Rhizobium sp. NTR19]|uniref:Helix-turn-helix domain-containing protein n=1 Tax=Neorhizobium turbinariae TaxID=2937795 RepID=A0ABT0IXW5_9HYPH|nr:helix-turn-helix domain-containing protein [Neorhizobium turbinariae]MCK8782726.1 helix-turn-helix domain-containing protein [Neorhizobium turbinariae]